MWVFFVLVSSSLGAWDTGEQETHRHVCFRIRGAIPLAPVSHGLKGVHTEDEYAIRQTHATGDGAGERARDYASERDGQYAQGRSEAHHVGSAEGARA